MPDEKEHAEAENPEASPIVNIEPKELDPYDNNELKPEASLQLDEPIIDEQ